MQALITYGIVVLATAYAAWVLMPRRLREGLLDKARRIAPARMQAVLARLEAEQPGCSSCKACGAEARAATGLARPVQMRRR